MSLSVGVASVDITPPPGLDITGNLWSTPSLGTRDPLLCKALVFDDGTSRAALVAVDIIGLERPEAPRAREFIATRSTIPSRMLVLVRSNCLEHIDCRSDNQVTRFRC